MAAVSAQTVSGEHADPSFLACVLLGKLAAVDCPAWGRGECFLSDATSASCRDGRVTADKDTASAAPLPESFARLKEVHSC